MTTPAGSVLAVLDTIGAKAGGAWTELRLATVFIEVRYYQALVAGVPYAVETTTRTEGGRKHWVQGRVLCWSPSYRARVVASFQSLFMAGRRSKV